MFSRIRSLKRLWIKYSCIAFAIFYIPRAQCTVAKKLGDSTCVDFTNSSAKIWREENLGRFLETNNISLVEINRLGIFISEPFRDSIGKCIGAMDITYSQLVGDILADKQCRSAMNDFVLKLVNEFLSKNHGEDQQVKSFFKSANYLFQVFGLDIFLQVQGWMAKLTNDDHAQNCRIITKSLNPCISNIILPLLFDKIDSTPCCESMKALVLELTGSVCNAEAVKTLLQLLENILCATSDEYASQGVPKYCGHAFVQTFLDTKFYENILSYFQMPNDQACAAFNGLQFQRTDNVTKVYSKKYGSCSHTLDALISYLKNLKFVLDRFSSKVFDEKQCCMVREIPIVQSYEGDEFRSESLGNICIHIPSNYSSRCKFHDKIIQYPSCINKSVDTQEVVKINLPESSTTLPAPSQSILFLFKCVLYYFLYHFLYY